MKQILLIGILLLCLSDITTGIHLRHESTEQRKNNSDKKQESYSKFVETLRSNLDTKGYKDTLIDSINKEQLAFMLDNSQKDLNLDNINSPWDSKRLEKLGLFGNLVSIKVERMQPTQNEIGLQNSLDWAISQYDATQYFGGKPAMIGGPVLTYGDLNNKNEPIFVLDGHHRWSQLYMLNPEAEILAFNIKKVDGIEPLEMLKRLQKTLAAYFGKLPEATGEGTINVFTQEKETIGYLNCRFREKEDDSSKCSNVETIKSNEKHKFVSNTFIDSYIKESGLTVKGNNKREAVKSKILDNIKMFVEKMKKKNPNLDKNPERKNMPQTDGPGDLHLAQINDQRGLLKDGPKIYTLPAILLRLMKKKDLSKEPKGMYSK